MPRLADLQLPRLPLGASGGGGIPPGPEVLSKTVTVNNTSGASQTDYQIKVPITWVSGMRTDFGDVRFPEAATPTAYWIDPSTVVAGVSATAWVRLAALAVASVNISLTYGGGRVATTGSIADTFIFGDDFNASSTLDTAKWNTGTQATYNWVDIDQWEFHSVVMTGRTFEQGCCRDATYWYCGINNGNGVDGSINLYDMASPPVFVKAIPGAPHCNGLSIREDNGNVISCSAGDSTVKRIVETEVAGGTKVRTWNIGTILMHSGAPNGAWMGNHRFICIVTNPLDASDYYAQILVLDDTLLTATLETTIPLSNVNVPQPVSRYQNVWYEPETKRLSVMVDDGTLAGDSGGSIHRWQLDETFTSSSPLMSLKHLPANERESYFTYQGMHYYSTNAGSLNRIEVYEKNQLQVLAAAATNTGAAAIGKAAVSGLSQYALCGRVAIRGNYPWFAMIDSPTPNFAANPTNAAIMGRFSAADVGLRSRQLIGGVSTTRVLATTSDFDDFGTKHNYEIRFNNAVMESFYDGVSKGTDACPNVSSVPLYPALRVVTVADGAGGEISADFVFIRKWQTTEPVVTGA